MLFVLIYPISGNILGANCALPPACPRIMRLNRRSFPKEIAPAEGLWPRHSALGLDPRPL